MQTLILELIYREWLMFIRPGWRMLGVPLVDGKCGNLGGHLSGEGEHFQKRSCGHFGKGAPRGFIQSKLNQSSMLLDCIFNRSLKCNQRKLIGTNTSCVPGGRGLGFRDCESASLLPVFGGP